MSKDLQINPIIKIESLSKIYNATRAVDNITFSISQGEVVGYLGHNGAGKTTTLKILTGMINASSGRAIIDGQIVTPENTELKARIGYVPESGAMYECLSPWEYLLFIGRLYGLQDKSIEQKAADILNIFGMYEHRDERIETFSKGMKQKIVITSSLLHNPDIIFFDEPLNGLDVNSMMIFKELIKQLAANGKTIVYSSHMLDIVEKVCSRVIILEKGKITADDTVENLLKSHNTTTLEQVFKQLAHLGNHEAIAQDLVHAMEQ